MVQPYSVATQELFDRAQRAIDIAGRLRTENAALLQIAKTAHDNLEATLILQDGELARVNYRPRRS